MDDKLKPNQEKRIIENCVESIMDDLEKIKETLS